MARRVLNIVLRTAHMGSMGVLLGGHAFGVSSARLRPSLVLTIATGAALLAVEAGPRLLWFHQGRGLMTLGKLGFLCLVPLAWSYRVAILITVVVIASVGSHMPGRYRYYSILSRKVIQDASGPGGASLEDPTGPLSSSLSAPGRTRSEA